MFDDIKPRKLYDIIVVVFTFLFIFRPSRHPTVPGVVNATMSGSSGQTKCILEDKDTVVQQKEK